MAKPAKIDLCRIRTDRFRLMTKPQLMAARWRMRGFTPEPPGSPGRVLTNDPRVMLGDFLSALIKLHASVNDARTQRKLGNGRSADQHYYRDPVDKLERRIWDVQAQAGCRISDVELVARDAVLEKRYGEANRIRRSKRRAGLRPRR